MEQIIRPSALRGRVWAPASKSVMQRACAAALIRKGHTILNQYGTSNDDQAALGIIQALGATVKVIDDNSLSICSPGFPNGEGEGGKRIIHCGESGLSVRMFTPVAALLSQPVAISGSGSLSGRPLHFFDQVLPQLGVRVNSRGGLLPLEVRGPLHPETITVDGSLSSQFLTGLLFAYGASVGKSVTIYCPGLKSKPYIRLTLQVMAAFGLRVPETMDLETFVFPECDNLPVLAQPIEYTIEGDWSGAAFLLVAGAIAGTIEVKGLDPESEQADRQILDVLAQCGCSFSWQRDTLLVAKTALQPFHFDATHCPDLFPPLVALAAYIKGKSSIQGVSRLAHKESNRALTLQQEFAKLGIQVSLQDDLMIIEGKEQVEGGTVTSHNDHRIAMACAVAALRARHPVHIQHAEAIHKSYPGFYKHLEQLQHFP